MLGCRAVMLKHQIAVSFDRGMVHWASASPEDVIRDYVQFPHTGGEEERNYTR
jgi:hypothetical protein